jgi:hypothetical protein
MSSEEIITEILHDSAEKGIRLKVLENALHLMNEDSKLTRVDAYQQAYSLTLSN